jgi:hypothetical protein
VIPNLVTRKGWGARPRRGRVLLPPERVRFLVGHYSAMNADEQAKHRNCAARVRGIQNFHMDHRGWDDVAYNWVACKHGYVFQGRGWRTKSAATRLANGYTVAVCFLGDDTAGRDDVTDAGRDAIRNVLLFTKRNARRLEGIRGHRDFIRTSCPGDELYAFLRMLDRSVFPGELRRR